MKPMKLEITQCPTCGTDQIKQVCRDWTVQVISRVGLRRAGAAFTSAPSVANGYSTANGALKRRAKPTCLGLANVCRRRTVPRNAAEGHLKTWFGI